MLLYHHISLFFARQYFSLHFMPYIDPAVNKAGWPLVFYLNFCQQCPDNPAHFTQTTICLWRMLSCCVGCRICSCVLVFNSAFCFATFLWLLCPLESIRGGRMLQLLHLQSSAEGSQWLLLCSEVSYQLQFRAAGREAVEISTVVIQCYEVLSPCLLRKHEWNTICWLHTYISCNLSMMLWKEKKIPLHRDMMLPNTKLALLICMAAQSAFQPRLFWTCRFKWRKGRGNHVFLQFCINWIYDIQRRKAGLCLFVLI